MKNQSPRPRWRSRFEGPLIPCDRPGTGSHDPVPVFFQENATGRAQPLPAKSLITQWHIHSSGRSGP